MTAHKASRARPDLPLILFGDPEHQNGRPPSHTISCSFKAACVLCTPRRFRKERAARQRRKKRHSRFEAEKETLTHSLKAPRERTCSKCQKSEERVAQRRGIKKIQSAFVPLLSSREHTEEEEIPPSKCHISMLMNAGRRYN